MFRHAQLYDKSKVNAIILKRFNSPYSSEDYDYIGELERNISIQKDELLSLTYSITKSLAAALGNTESGFFEAADAAVVAYQLNDIIKAITDLDFVQDELNGILKETRTDKTRTN